MRGGRERQSMGGEDGGVEQNEVPSSETRFEMLCSQVRRSSPPFRDATPPEKTAGAHAAANGQPGEAVKHSGGTLG